MYHFVMRFCVTNKRKQNLLKRKSVNRKGRYPVEQYYTEKEGRIFLIHPNYLELFDPTKKDWSYIFETPGEWLKKNQFHEITEITESQATERLEIQILDNLDRSELQKHINLLCHKRKIRWHPMGEGDGGALMLGYPCYPEELSDIFNLLGHDRDYRQQMKNWPPKLYPTDMDVWQIRTALTYFQRAERFCDGIIAEALEDRTLLKLLLRLDDLLNAHQHKSRKWDCWPP